MKLGHRSKIECYPSFYIRIKYMNIRDYIESGAWLRVAALVALGFEIHY